jgi:hypothetical protein
MSMQPRFIPDAECVQRKCANVTTGCRDACMLRSPGWVVAAPLPAEQAASELRKALQEITDAADTFMGGGVSGLRAAINKARAALAARQAPTQAPTCWIEPIELRELERGTVAMVVPVEGDAQRIPLFRSAPDVAVARDSVLEEAALACKTLLQRAEKMMQKGDPYSSGTLAVAAQGIMAHECVDTIRALKSGAQEKAQ